MKPANRSSCHVVITRISTIALSIGNAGASKASSQSSSNDGDASTATRYTPRPRARRGPVMTGSSARRAPRSASPPIEDIQGRMPLKLPQTTASGSKSSNCPNQARLRPSAQTVDRGAILRMVHTPPMPRARLHPPQTVKSLHFAAFACIMFAKAAPSGTGP